MFMRCVGEWICDLPDRYDHHPRLIPYILSGLFDEFPDVRQIAIAALDQAGLLEEREKEKEFREGKQYGIDAEWT